MTQFIDPPYDLVLRVAAMDAVTRQDEQVLGRRERNGAALGLRDHELLHLNVTERATNAQFAVYAIVKDMAVRCFDSHALILSVRRVLLVELHPRAVAANKCRHRVTDVGHGEATVK